MQSSQHFTRKWIAVLVTLCMAFVLVLSGCGNNNQNSNEQKNTGNETPKQDTEVRKIEHAMGTTEIKGTPKRVVILTNEGTEALLALGVKPVGAVNSWVGDPWYDHIKEKMDGVQELGTEDQPNLELIAGLKPDLIIGNKMRQEKVYEQLKAIAPTVFAETLRGEWKENFKLYANALNKADEGDKVIEQFDSRVNDLKQKLQDAGKLGTQVSLVRFMAGDTRIYHKDTFAGIILDQIGLARPESQNKDDFAAKNLTKERMPEMDGDIMFYYTYETGDGEASKLEKEWTNDPLWKKLKVVQNQQVYKVNDITWNTAGGVLSANLMLDDLYKYFQLQA